MGIFIARPNSDGPDYIYNIYGETEKYYLTSGGMIPKSIVDTEKSWHRNYYFSSQEKQNEFYKKFYKEEK